MDREHTRILNYLTSKPWAITADWLELIGTIAAGWGEGPQALQERLGRPLENTRTAMTRENGVAVIPIQGPLMARAGFFQQVSGGLTPLEATAKDIRTALDDPSVRALVLDMDTPGGEIGGTVELAELLYRARGEKPTTAYVSDLGASGGYWIASAVDRIVVAPTALVGSIGVVATARIDKEQRYIEIVSSGAPGKRPDIQSDAGRAQMQAMVDRLEVEFVSAVSRYRDVSADTVRTDFGRGGLLVGADAVAAGMADEVGLLEDVIAGYAGTNRRSYPMGNSAKQAGQDPAKHAAEGDETTVDNLRAEHPDLCEEIEASGYQKGFTAGKEESAPGATAAGAKAERERIKALLELDVEGFEDKVTAAIDDGKTTSAELALQIMKAQQDRGSTVAKLAREGQSYGVSGAPISNNTEDAERKALLAAMGKGMNKGRRSAA